MRHDRRVGGDVNPGSHPRNELDVIPRSRLALFATLALAGLGAVVAPSAAAQVPPATNAVLREADIALVDADRQAVRLRQALAEARRARNAVATACVDRQLIQLNSFTRILQQHRGRLQAAIERRSDTAIAHERSVIRRMSEELHRIARTGLSCVNPHGGPEDRTIVIVTIAPETPEFDDLRAPPPPPH